MFPTSVAQGYAKGIAGAVPKGAGAHESLSALAAEYRQFTELLRTSPELTAALCNPALSTLQKTELMDAVLDSAGATPLLRAFATLVVRNGHAAGFEAIGSVLDREVAAAQGILDASIRVARPIGEAETRAIADALGKALGREVRPQVTVDPALIGGFVARAGDLVFDGSIARQMERLRSELVRG